MLVDMGKYPILSGFSLENLRQMSPTELTDLATEIRLFLIDTLSINGGHLASNLGVVELTIMLFQIFNSPDDKFFWDIGHQSYVHKILTGRADKFDTLRQLDGISGFIKQTESPYDIWEAGHASTSLSGAAGISVQRKLNKQKYHILSIIGDGALTGGMALEALNHIGDLAEPHIIVLNDNNMSISQNVGALSHHINELRMSNKYVKAKKGTREFLDKSKVGRGLSYFLYNVKQKTKRLFTTETTTFFESMGLIYYGPIDGHDFEQLRHAFEYTKTLKTPVILHIMTKKGKGYTPAEEDEKGVWHGIGPYLIDKGEKVRKKENMQQRQWSSVVSETIERLAALDEKIIAITPAMIKGSKLTHFAKKYPGRLFDVGIAEEHAVTFAGGAGLRHGLKPFIAIYSTFLQRSYDQLLHDLVRQKLPVVVGVDRCGFAGGDGETHHGIYDISFMRAMPNLTICMGKDDIETQNLLYSALYDYTNDGTVALRYPRGYSNLRYVAKFENIPKGTWTKEMVAKDTKIAILTFGPQLKVAERIVEKIGKKFVTIINARFIKPMDTKMLQDVFTNYPDIVTIEEAVRIGGFGSGVLEFANANNYKNNIHVFAIADEFIEQGSNSQLQQIAKIDCDSITNILKERIEWLKNE
jgi:1-deoxy-D-xylulose-5-phosphate synthase